MNGLRCRSKWVKLWRARFGCLDSKNRLSEVSLFIIRPAVGPEHVLVSQGSIFILYARHQVGKCSQRFRGPDSAPLPKLYYVQSLRNISQISSVLSYNFCRPSIYGRSLRLIFRSATQLLANQ
jgi:hypothetical protein